MLSAVAGGATFPTLQTDKTHYELILQPEANQARDHFQWFYFEVGNISYCYKIEQHDQIAASFTPIDMCNV